MSITYSTPVTYSEPWTYGGTGASAPPPSWALSAYRFRVRIALDAGPRDLGATWLDVTADVLGGPGLQFRRGRQADQLLAEAGTASLTLRNWAAPGLPAGRWTPGLVTGPYHPLRLKRRVAIDVRVSGAWIDLWQGHVTDWRPSWLSPQHPTTVLNASGRLADAAAQTLPGWVAAIIAQRQPTAWWPLDEPEGARRAGSRVNASTMGSLVAEPIAGSDGGALDFGAGSLGVDRLTAAAFTPAGPGDGLRLLGRSKPLGAVRTVEVWANRGATRPMSALHLVATNGDYLAVGCDADGFPALTWRAGGVTGEPVSAPVTWRPRTWKHLAVVIDADLGETRLHVDGDAWGSIPYVWPEGFDAWRTISVGGVAGTLWDGQLAHVALYGHVMDYYALIENYLAAGGIPGESAASRFARVCHIASIIPTGGFGDASTEMAPQPIRDRKVPDVLAEIADTEQGAVVETASGSLALIPREDYYTGPLWLTLDARRDVLADMGDAFALDDQGLVNAVDVSRAGQEGQRVTDAASIEAHGERTGAVTVYTMTDAEAIALAQWVCGLRAQPAPSAPQLRISMAVLAADLDKCLQAAAMRPGYRIRVTHLPVGAPASELDLIVASIDDQVGADWTRTLHVVPARPWIDTFRFDDPARGRFDGPPLGY